MNSIHKYLIPALLLLVLSGGTLQAGEPCLDACIENGKCGPPCCPQPCDPYKATCNGCWEQDKEEHYCWQVEKDFVCIPPVRFPWQKCCDLGCPRIRKVSKLKIYKYDCDVCKFKWNLKKFYPCCDQEGCIPEVSSK
ncbi:hypothetical protein [Rubinisphaera italica]|uniref:Uncharacterized protein n=1 Tax=Rubinisphaera italica TaxID=2527969 RepID=A0A5C5XHC6_9PLAN|nr:hypothetical protein [Rubinisphaera italica]TWT62566.1 hypothetical protein Pan54_33090 [Rubinisphaera italica]